MRYAVVVVVGGGQTRALTNRHVNSSNFDALYDSFPAVGEGFFHARAKVMASQKGSESGPGLRRRRVGKK